MNPEKPGAGQPAKPTMVDVARLAGVSAMTVSRALRNSQSVSPETAHRIHKAVDVLGYVVDLAAGSLSSRRTGFVSAIIPTLNNSNFSDTVRGINDILAGQNLQVLLGYTDYSMQREEELVETMLRRRPEGIIITGSNHTARTRKLLERADVPVVEIWDLPKAPMGSVVGFSNAAAVAELVHYLARKGYQRIGFIGGASGLDTRGTDRRLGYSRAIAELGLPTGRIVSFGQVPITMRQGGQAMVQMLEHWPDTDAVICVSDLSAFGAVMECHRRGWAVPGRVAVAGFGNFEVSTFSYPSITSVGVDNYKIGVLAAEQVIANIRARNENIRLEPEIVLVDYNVHMRESA